MLKRVATCNKHAAKALDEAVGRRSPKTLRVSRVTDPAVNRGSYFCYCGKPADFYLAEVEGNVQGAKGSAENQKNSNTH